MKEYDSLGLIDFEFMNHWETQQERADELIDYSLKEDGSIYTCFDGGAIIVADGKIEYYGEIHEITKGEMKRKATNTNSISK